MDTDDKLRYPVGRTPVYETITQEMINSWIVTLQELPGQIRELLKEALPEEENAKYRKGGWTIRQVVHHLADSHMNAYIRFKLGLTEETPTVKPYFEERWAELPDTFNTPVSYSIQILDGMHTRLTNLLKTMKPADFEKAIYHPEHKKNISLGQLTGTYAWHSLHHLEHIRIAKQNYEKGISLP